MDFKIILRRYEPYAKTVVDGVERYVPVDEFSVRETFNTPAEAALWVLDNYPNYYQGCFIEAVGEPFTCKRGNPVSYVYELFNLDIENTRANLVREVEREYDGYVRGRESVIRRGDVPASVEQHIKDYFETELPLYGVCYIEHKSNSISDKNFFQVIAYDNKNNKFACWTSWKEDVMSLNHGHYGLSSFMDAKTILNDNYRDCRDDYLDEEKRDFYKGEVTANDTLGIWVAEEMDPFEPDYGKYINNLSTEEPHYITCFPDKALAVDLSGENPSLNCIVYVHNASSPKKISMLGRDVCVDRQYFESLSSLIAPLCNDGNIQNGLRRDNNPYLNDRLDSLGLGSATNLACGLELVQPLNYCKILYASMVNCVGVIPYARAELADKDMISALVDYKNGQTGILSDINSVLDSIKGMLEQSGHRVLLTDTLKECLAHFAEGNLTEREVYGFEPYDEDFVDFFDDSVLDCVTRLGKMAEQYVEERAKEMGTPVLKPIDTSLE